jgi:CheY-like chemotaxis protein
MSRILLIDDDPAVRDSMERTLRNAGYAVQSAASGEEGYRRKLVAKLLSAKRRRAKNAITAKTENLVSLSAAF